MSPATLDGGSGAKGGRNKLNITDFPEIFKAALDETQGLDHGIVRLELHVRDGRLYRYEVSRTRSVLVERTGEAPQSSTRKELASGGRYG